MHVSLKLAECNTASLKTQGQRDAGLGTKRCVCSHFELSIVIQSPSLKRSSCLAICLKRLTALSLFPLETIDDLTFGAGVSYISLTQTPGSDSGKFILALIRLKKK